MVRFVLPLLLLFLMLPLPLLATEDIEPQDVVIDREKPETALIASEADAELIADLELLELLGLLENMNSLASMEDTQ